MNGRVKLNGLVYIVLELNNSRELTYSLVEIIVFT